MEPNPYQAPKVPSEPQPYPARGLLGFRPLTIRERILALAVILAMAMAWGVWEQLVSPLP